MLTESFTLGSGHVLTRSRPYSDRHPPNPNYYEITDQIKRLYALEKNITLPIQRAKWKSLMEKKLAISNVKHIKRLAHLERGFREIQRNRESKWFSKWLHKTDWKHLTRSAKISSLRILCEEMLVQVHTEKQEEIIEQWEDLVIGLRASQKGARLIQLRNSKTTRAIWTHWRTQTEEILAEKARLREIWIDFSHALYSLNFSEKLDREFSKLTVIRRWDSLTSSLLEYAVERERIRRELQQKWQEITTNLTKERKLAKLVFSSNRFHMRRLWHLFIKTHVEIHRQQELLHEQQSLQNKRRMRQIVIDFMKHFKRAEIESAYSEFQRIKDAKRTAKLGSAMLLRWRDNAQQRKAVRRLTSGMFRDTVRTHMQKVCNHSATVIQRSFRDYYDRWMKQRQGLLRYIIAWRRVAQKMTHKMIRFPMLSIRVDFPLIVDVSEFVQHKSEGLFDPLANVYFYSIAQKERKVEEVSSELVSRFSLFPPTPSIRREELGTARKMSSIVSKLLLKEAENVQMKMNIDFNRPILDVVRVKQTEYQRSARDTELPKPSESFIDDFASDYIHSCVENMLTFEHLPNTGIAALMTGLLVPDREDRTELDILYIEKRIQETRRFHSVYQMLEMPTCTHLTRFELPSNRFNLEFVSDLKQELAREIEPNEVVSLPNMSCFKAIADPVVSVDDSMARKLAESMNLCVFVDPHNVESIRSLERPDIHFSGGIVPYEVAESITYEETYKFVTENIDATCLSEITQIEEPHAEELDDFIYHKMDLRVDSVYTPPDISHITRMVPVNDSFVQKLDGDFLVDVKLTIPSLMTAPVDVIGTCTHTHVGENGEIEEIAKMLVSNDFVAVDAKIAEVKCNINHVIDDEQPEMDENLVDDIVSHVELAKLTVPSALVCKGFLDTMPCVRSSLDYNREFPEWSFEATISMPETWKGIEALMNTTAVELPHYELPIIEIPLIIEGDLVPTPPQSMSIVELHQTEIPRFDLPLVLFEVNIPKAVCALNTLIQEGSSDEDEAKEYNCGFPLVIESDPLYSYLSWLEILETVSVPKFDVDVDFDLVLQPAPDVGFDVGSLSHFEVIPRKIAPIPEYSMDLVVESMVNVPSQVVSLRNLGLKNRVDMSKIVDEKAKSTTDKIISALGLPPDPLSTMFLFNFARWEPIKFTTPDCVFDFSDFCCVEQLVKIDLSSIHSYTSREQMRNDADSVCRVLDEKAESATSKIINALQVPSDFLSPVPLFNFTRYEPIKYTTPDCSFDASDFCSLEGLVKIDLDSIRSYTSKEQTGDDTTIVCQVLDEKEESAASKIINALGLHPDPLSTMFLFNFACSESIKSTTPDCTFDFSGFFCVEQLAKIDLSRIRSYTSREQMRNDADSVCRVLDEKAESATSKIINALQVPSDFLSPVPLFNFTRYEPIKYTTPDCSFDFSDFCRVDQLAKIDLSSIRSYTAKTQTGSVTKSVCQVINEKSRSAAKRITDTLQLPYDPLSTVFLFNFSRSEPIKFTTPDCAFDFSNFCSIESLGKINLSSILSYTAKEQTGSSTKIVSPYLNEKSESAANKIINALQLPSDPLSAMFLLNFTLSEPIKCASTDLVFQSLAEVCSSFDEIPKLMQISHVTDKLASFSSSTPAKQDIQPLGDIISLQLNVDLDITSLDRWTNASVCTVSDSVTLTEHDLPELECDIEASSTMIPLLRHKSIAIQDQTSEIPSFTYEECDISMMDTKLEVGFLLNYHPSLGKKEEASFNIQKVVQLSIPEPELETRAAHALNYFTAKAKPESKIRNHKIHLPNERADYLIADDYNSLMMLHAFNSPKFEPQVTYPVVDIELSLGDIIDHQCVDSIKNFRQKSKLSFFSHDFSEHLTSLVTSLCSAQVLSVFEVATFPHQTTRSEFPRSSLVNVVNLLTLNDRGQGSSEGAMFISESYGLYEEEETESECGFVFQSDGEEPQEYDSSDVIIPQETPEYDSESGLVISAMIDSDDLMEMPEETEDDFITE